MSSVKACLICMVGLPASGKSTLAEIIQERYKNVYTVNIICFDKEISWCEEIRWKQKRQSVKNLVITHLKNYLSRQDMQWLIILDDNMFYRSMRYEYYQLASQFKVGFCQLFLSSSLDTCIKRNASRDSLVDDNTIKKMNSLLEVPDSRANKWEFNTCNVDILKIKDSWTILDNLISNCLQNPVKQIKMQKEICIPNRIHLADIALRKIVADIIKDFDVKEKCGIGELVKRRHELLEEIRTGNIHLPENEENCFHVYSKYLRSFF